MNQVNITKYDADITYTASVPCPFKGITLTGGYLENHPKAGKVVTFRKSSNAAAFKAAKVKDVAVHVRVEGKPDLAELVVQVEAHRAARDAEFARKRAEEEARDAALVAKMEEEFAAILATVPADRKLVEMVKTGTFDGDATYEYRLDGEVIPRHVLDDHGSAFAKRPGAMNAFEVRCAYTANPEKLAAWRAENAAKAAKKAEAIAAREEAKRIPEGWKVEVGPQTYRGRGEGSEIRAEVTVTSPSGMVYRYVAVNIFDAGMGLYRPEGGLAKAGAMGEEVLAIEYALRRIPEGLKAVRM